MLSISSLPRRALRPNSQTIHCAARGPFHKFMHEPFYAIANPDGSQRWHKLCRWDDTHIKLRVEAFRPGVSLLGTTVSAPKF